VSASLKEKTIKGVFWSSIERFSVQGIQFILGIIMARLLTPADYGVIGMLAVFLAVSQTFVDSGFSSALIRKQNRTEVDFSTAFYFNIAIGIICYLLLFLLSPFIADFFDTPILIPVTKVVGLNVLINSFVVVQRAKLSISIDFKTQAKASSVAVLISGSVGLLLAYSGYGVWALAFQSVLNTGINMVLLWILSKWRPAFVFSYESFKEMFSFGSKLLVSGLIDTIYKNLYTLIIGKKFSKEDLGYYTRADNFTQFPSSNITGILQRVTFPVLSSIQDDDEKLSESYRNFLRLSAFVVFPLMIGLAALAKPFILFFLTEKWVGAILLLQILCLASMWYPIHAINLNLLQVKGRSDLFLKLEIIKKSISISILFITVPISVTAMGVGMIVSSLLALIVNTYYTGKLIHVGFFRQMKDLLPILFYSLLMGISVYFSISLLPNAFLQLIVGLIVGFVTYFTIAYLTKSKELKSLLSLVKK
jgi:O-antigen/teichoic acid export membrane protein